MRFDTDQLTDLLEVTTQATNLYVPAVISGTSRFALYGKQGETTEPNFELQNTKIPPKVFLSPQRKSSIRGEGLLRVRLSKAHCSRQRPL